MEKSPHIELVKIEQRTLNAEAVLRLMGRCEPLVSRTSTVIILDLTNVRFMDSLAVSGIICLAKKLDNSSRLILVVLSRYARSVADATHLEDVVEIYATAEQAVSQTAA